jgi:hypothetical protein
MIGNSSSEMTVSIPSNFPGVGTWSVLLRVRPDVAANGYVFNSRNASGPRDNAIIWDFVATTFETFISPASDGRKTIKDVGSAGVGQWHNVGFSYSDSLDLLDTYYNGLRTSTNSVTVSAANHADLIVGNSLGTNTDYFQGKYGFIYMWNRFLTQGEHAQLHRDPYCFFLFPRWIELIAAALGVTPAQVARVINNGFPFGEGFPGRRRGIV